MPHYSRLDKIVIDIASADHDRELAFWQGALGQELEQFKRYPEYHGAPLAKQDFGFLTQHLGEGTSRVHLDIHTDDLEAEVARLESLGAKRIRQVNSWWIMEDPAGLPFCVIPDNTLNENNSQRWE